MFQKDLIRIFQKDLTLSDVGMVFGLFFGGLLSIFGRGVQPRPRPNKSIRLGVIRVED